MTTTAEHIVSPLPVVGLVSLPGSLRFGMQNATPQPGVLA
jgi:hypothetical protein